jgi:two-component system OmpR family response regulator
MTQDALKKIVVVDDDREILTLLTEYLTLNRFEVVAFETGEAFLESARSSLNADIAILDVMLPGITGFDVCRELRGFSRMPVIMLTANSDEMDRIVGLELGADDYLAKPFNPRELLARIRAVLRRIEPTTSMQSPKRMRRFVRFDGFELDLTSRRLWTEQGDTGALTGADYHLLNLFLSQPGVPLTREFIAEQTRGRDNLPMDRFVDVHISRLRQRLNDPSTLIQTVRGKGYLLACTVEFSDKASLVTSS